MIRYTRILMISLLLLSMAQGVLADLPMGEPVTLNEVSYIINSIARFLIVTSVIIAVIFIVLSGIRRMYAGSDTTKIKDANAMLRSGIIGSLIVLGVGVIISTLAALVTRQFFCRFSLWGVCIIK